MSIPVHIMTKLSHCAACPMTLLCFARTPLSETPRVTYCARCFCVTINSDDAKYVCTILRKGAHSRLDPNDPQYINYKDVEKGKTVESVATSYKRQIQALGIERVSSSCTALWRQEEHDNDTLMTWKYKDCAQFYAAEFNADVFCDDCAQSD